MTDAAATVFFRFTILLSLLFPFLSEFIYKNKGIHAGNTIGSPAHNEVFLLNSALLI